MWHLRVIVSHLVEVGHAQAPDYPIAFAFDEYQIVTERENGRSATHATLLQAAASTAVAAFGKDGGKKAFQSFSNLVKRLAGTSSIAQDSPKKPGDVEQGRTRNGPKRR